MRLTTLTYSEFEGSPQYWSLDELRLGPKNLVVGKNSTGKTRVLNIIDSLARLLVGLIPPPNSGTYDATFIEGEKTLRYELTVDNGGVLAERFSENNRVLLERGRGGEGWIYAAKINSGESVQFQTPINSLGAVARRDSIQHAFLEPLHVWAASVRHYFFGDAFGKRNVAVLLGTRPLIYDERNQDSTMPVWVVASEEFGSAFKDAIMEDMKCVGYELEDIGIGAPISVRMESNAPGPLVMLFVKEKDLPGITDQPSMSQGMYRALALFIHLNYCTFKRNATLVLIDDIGEGLDFVRSCQLIDRVREKADSELIQIVLSTNDRFVMNRVPLDEWSVLQRKGGAVSVRNVQNSKEQFEEFRFTGLSNFSLLEMDFLNQNESR